MRTILVPLDGSSLAEVALPVAVRVARRTGAHLVLASVHAPEMPVRGGQGAMVFDARWDQEQRDVQNGALKATRDRVAREAPDLSVEAVMLDGLAADALTAYAASLPVALVVMTTHGRGGATRLWLGSVTDDLVRHLRTVPLLVVRGDGEPGATPADGDPFRVLVPIDGQPASESIVDAAVEVFGTEGVEYELLLAEAPPHPAIREVHPGLVIQHVTETPEADAVEALRASEARLRKRGLTVRGTIRSELQPARAILDHARETSPDVIAVATHGRGRLGRLVFGSVADKVLRGATVPVLVARAAAATTMDSAATASARATPATPLSTTAARTPASGSASLPRLDRAVVALDFGDSSRTAAAWTAQHVAPGAELTLVHAVWVPQPPRFLGESVVAHRQLVETARCGAEHRMRELGAAVEGHRVRSEIREGEPAQVVADAAAELGADLIVVGEHGPHTGLSRRLGTTAERIADRAVAPVLVVRGTPVGAPARVLAAIDDDADADRVIAWVRLLMHRFDPRVVLLHTVDPLFVAAPIGPSGAERASAFEQVGDSTRRWLAERVQQCVGSTHSVTTAVTFGDPATEIVRAAERGLVDLIVIGHGGAGRLARAMTGRVARRVLRDFRRPVLLIPASDATA